MPVMHMFAVNSANLHDPAGSHYECPIYSKPSRRNRVAVVDLKTAITPAQCVVRGVALLCATSNWAERNCLGTLVRYHRCVVDLVTSYTKRRYTAYSQSDTFVCNFFLTSVLLFSL